jgi:hypothetical protein
VKAGTSFDFDPRKCIGEEDRFLECGDDIGRSLFPIGLIEDDRFFLGIDDSRHIGWQTVGKCGDPGWGRRNIPYPGPQGPVRGSTPGWKTGGKID